MFLTVLYYLLLTVFILVSLLLTLLVLMQRPKSEGLGAAFGSGVTDTLFGAGTTDFLTKATIGMGALFFSLTLVLAVIASHKDSPSPTLEKELLSEAPSAEVEELEVPGVEEITSEESPVTTESEDTAKAEAQKAEKPEASAPEKKK